MLFVATTSLVFAQNDRISVRVEFKKFVWTCPQCANEEITDQSPSGGNEYEHICSKCGAKFNQSGSNMKEYNGCLQYPFDVYPSVKKEDIDKEKWDRCDKWIYEMKHPVPYVEPTVEMLEVEKAEAMQKVTEIQARIDAKAVIGD